MFGLSARPWEVMTRYAGLPGWMNTVSFGPQENGLLVQVVGRGKKGLLIVCYDCTVAGPRLDIFCLLRIDHVHDRVRDIKVVIDVHVPQRVSFPAKRHVLRVQPLRCPPDR